MGQEFLWYIYACRMKMWMLWCQLHENYRRGEVGGGGGSDRKRSIAGVSDSSRSKRQQQTPRQQHPQPTIHHPPSPLPQVAKDIAILYYVGPPIVHGLPYTFHCFLVMARRNVGGVCKYIILGLNVGLLVGSCKSGLMDCVSPRPCLLLLSLPPPCI